MYSCRYRNVLPNFASLTRLSIIWSYKDDLDVYLDRNIGLGCSKNSACQMDSRIYTPVSLCKCRSHSTSSRACTGTSNLHLPLRPTPGGGYGDRHDLESHFRVGILSCLHLIFCFLTYPAVCLAVVCHQAPRSTNQPVS